MDLKTFPLCLPERGSLSELCCVSGECARQSVVHLPSFCECVCSFSCWQSLLSGASVIRGCHHLCVKQCGSFLLSLSSLGLCGDRVSHILSLVKYKPLWKWQGCAGCAHCILTTTSPITSQMTLSVVTLTALWGWCICYVFLVAKYLTKETYRRKRLFWFMVWGLSPSRQGRCLSFVSRHLRDLTEGPERDACCYSGLLFCSPCMFWACEMGLLKLEVGLPPSLNLLRKPPHRHALGCVCLLTPEATKLVIKTKHRNWHRDFCQSFYSQTLHGGLISWWSSCYWLILYSMPWREKLFFYLFLLPKESIWKYKNGGFWEESLGLVPGHRGTVDWGTRRRLLTARQQPWSLQVLFTTLMVLSRLRREGLWQAVIKKFFEETHTWGEETEQGCRKETLSSWKWLRMEGLVGCTSAWTMLVTRVALLKPQMEALSDACMGAGKWNKEACEDVGAVSAALTVEADAVFY